MAEMYDTVIQSKDLCHADIPEAMGQTFQKPWVNVNNIQ